MQDLDDKVTLKLVGERAKRVPEDRACQVKGTERTKSLRQRHA